ncbi:MAG: stage III sporulation protein AF, partial [Lachnospiraceae bacterium]|nr:stage III sporulation protein AF [Lachnospiraceae bacterium]
LEALPAGQDSKWEDGVIAEYQELIRRQSDELLDGLGMRAEAVELEREGSVVVGFTLRVTPERETEGTGGAGGPIRAISITDIVVQIGDTEGESGKNGGKTVYELAIKKRLADFYNMDESHIHVIIQ